MSWLRFAFSYEVLNEFLILAFSNSISRDEKRMYFLNSLYIEAFWHKVAHFHSVFQIIVFSTGEFSDNFLHLTSYLLVPLLSCHFKVITKY